MNPWRTRLAWTTAVVSFTIIALTKPLQLVLGQADEDLAIFVPVIFGATAMCGVGALVAARTGNPLGWILIAIPATTAVSLLAGAVVDGVMLGNVALSNTALGWTAWLAGWPFFVSLSLLVAVFYLFPTGRIASARWRWPWRLYVGALVVAIGGFMTLPKLDVGDTEIANPLGIEAVSGSLDLLIGAAALILVMSAFAAFVSLVSRYRGADIDERQQLRWLFLVGAIGAVLFLTFWVLVFGIFGNADEGPIGAVADVILVLLVTDVVVGIPLATGVAIFRYHLYDLGIVVRKTVVFGLLAVFITGVYVAVVVGIGALVDDPDSVALSVAATALVAVLFQPARERVEKVAARLVFGERATPYEVMAGFSERVARSVSVDHVLPEMAAAVGAGVRAIDATVRVSLSDGRELVERWSREGTDFTPAPAATTISITYHGDEVGAIEVTKPAAEPLSTAEQKLLADLAGQAGLALHNVRLTQELALRVAELDVQAAALRASRERLVTARDAQRRGLQRDLHEGPEQALVRIGQSLATVEHAEPTEVLKVLDRQLDEATTMLEDLRDLARGIFPPLLAEAGVVPALEAHIRKVGANATVEAGQGVRGRRFDDDLETCVYFCCLQTIQNVIRHAANAPTVVRLAAGGDALEVSIDDAGAGFDPAAGWGMGLAIVKDRVDALDGTLVIESTPGAGTQVRIRLPLATEVTVG